MKITLPPNLRAALVAASLLVVNYTMPCAQAAGVAETEVELSTPSLTQLHNADNINYPRPSAYQLEKITGETLASDISLYKLLFDADLSTYTPVFYNVVFNEILGDDSTVASGGVTQEYVWDKDVDTGQPILRAIRDGEVADITAYSSDNTRFDSTVTPVSGEKHTINHSFLGLTNNVNAGAAIYYNNTTTTLDVTGDFVGNKGNAVFNEGAIGDVRSNFIGNTLHIADGDSALQYDGGAAFKNRITVKRIVGDFIGNSVIDTRAADADNTPSVGGALYNYELKVGTGTNIEAIEGDFIANTVYSENGHANGAAIWNNVTITSVKGDFIGNVSIGKTAQAGAISNFQLMKNITGDFIGNAAHTSDLTTAAGAIYNGFLFGGLGLLAYDRSMSITGNYISNDGGITKDFVGIHNEYELALGAYGEHKIIVNDKITTSGSNGNIYINYKARNGEALGIEPDGGTLGDSIVEFNNEVNFGHLYIGSGTLKLGEFAGTTITQPDGSSYQVDASSAMLSTGNIYILSNGHLLANKADYLGESGDFFSTFQNSGLLSIGSGTLNRTIGTYGTGKVAILGQVNSNVLISSQNIIFNIDGTTSLGLNMSSTGSLENNSFELNFTDVSHKAGNFLSWDEGLTIMDQQTLKNILTVNLNGQSTGFYSLTQQDNAYSVEVVDVGAYKSDAGYFLDPVSADSTKIFTVTSASYNSVTGSVTSGLYSVEFDGVMGDDFTKTSADGAITKSAQFKWVIDEDTGGMILSEVGLAKGEGDFYAYSSHNQYLSSENLDAGTHTIERSFIALGAPDVNAGSGMRHSNADVTLNIIGDFIGIRRESIDGNTYGPLYGGAIYNSSKIENIKGDFIGNAVLSPDVSYGGAIYNKGATATITKITGDFVGNSVINGSDAGDLHGGAIYNTDGANIESIDGDFVGNNVFSMPLLMTEKSEFSGGAIYSNSTIGTIKGNFIGNSVDGSTAVLVSLDSYAQGGAIFNSGEMTDIEGDFAGNFVRNTFDQLNKSYSMGGAIANLGALGTIVGDFTENKAIIASRFSGFDAADDLTIYGGAIYNESTINSITGNFARNSVSEAVTSLDGVAVKSITIRGGAIYNTGTISSLTGDFVENSVLGNGSGGAIYNSGSIALLALTRNTSFTGNYLSTDGGSTKTFNAIDNSQIATEGAADATIRFNAYGDYSIVVNDSIVGNAETAANQHLIINDGNDGAAAAIVAGGLEHSTVKFNNTVSNQTISVLAGTLELGSFAGKTVTQSDGSSYRVEAASAELVNSTLTVSNNAQVLVQKGEYLGNDNTITATQQSSLNILAGILLNDITLQDDAKLLVNAQVTLNSMLTVTGSATIVGTNGVDWQLDSAIIGTNAQTSDGIALTLNNSSINFNDPGEPTTAPEGGLVGRNAISLNGVDMYTLNTGIDIAAVTGSLTLNVSMLDGESFLAQYYDSTTFALLINDVNGLSMAAFGEGYDFTSALKIYFNEYMGTVSSAQNMDGGGVLLMLTIPEPSTATLSLLALAGLLARRKRQNA